MTHALLLENKSRGGFQTRPTRNQVIHPIRKIDAVPARRVLPAVQKSLDQPELARPMPATAGYSFSQIAVFGGAGLARQLLKGGPTTSDVAETATETPSPDAGQPAEATQAPPATPEADVTRPVESSTAPEAAAETEARPSLSWEHHKRSPHDALWWFNGEHPRWFSINATLEASGYADPGSLNWRIVHGADKVAFENAPTGPSVSVRSTAGSRRVDDVEIEVKEGTAADAVAYTGKLTVRMPNRLIQRSVNDTANVVPLGVPAGTPGYWTTIDYRIVDNVGGTIVGATVNENFPGGKNNDQPNNWPGPAAFATTPSWPNTNGTFIDNWFITGGYNPVPVAPNAANANQSVDRMAHEFYIGSTTPGLGVRVQTHTAHRYLGFARHEGITTPAP